MALEIESFEGPCEISRADRRVVFGAHKTRTSSLKVAPHGPRQHALEDLAEFCLGIHLSRENLYFEQWQYYTAES